VEGNVATLEMENAQLRRENAELVKRIEILAEQVAWLKQRFFGRSSEVLSEEEQRQLRLFDEAEVNGEGGERPPGVI
jgi:cell division protein FtsB